MTRRHRDSPTGSTQGTRLALLNTGAMTIGQVLRAVIQLFYFVVLARTLGVDGYGEFVAIVSLVAIAGPLSGMGGGNLLIRDEAQGLEPFARSWGSALKVLLGSSSALIVAVVLVSRSLSLTESPVLVVGTVATADLLFGRVSELCGQGFQAVGRLGLTACVLVLQSLTRAAAAVLLLTGIVASTTQAWAIAYLCSSAIAAGVSLLVAVSVLGRPEWGLRWTLERYREGLLFSVGLSSQSVYNDIDKAMLARLDSFQSAGIYGAAYRVIDLVFIPVRSALAASYSVFFARGAVGVESARALAQRLARPLFAYAGAGALTLYWVAPALPRVLGSEFSSSVGALRGLAILPALKVAHYLAADTLTGSGYQKHRTIAQLSAAVTNVGLNLWLIPQYSWHGAVAASLLTDGFLALALWTLVIRFGRSERLASHTFETSS